MTSNGLLLRNGHCAAFGHGEQPVRAVAPRVAALRCSSREIVDGDQAMLEFQSELDGIQINGVDIIRWNDGGHVYVIYDTKDEALAHVRRLGWA